MKLQDLRAQFRSEADDAVAPYLFSDEDVDDWHNQAVEEAAVRADLLPEFDDAEVCAIDVTAGTSGYALHTAVTRVTHAAFTPDGQTEPTTLELIERVELDRRRPNWRTETGAPSCLLVEQGKVRLVPKPSTDGTLSLEVFRLPLTPMTADVDEPEIQAHHHRHLVDWALFRAYSKPDTETQDLARAGAAEARFEARFGRRPDADMKQASEARPHFNKVWL
jgi:hypothetical protein